MKNESESVSRSVLSDSCNPMDCCPPGSSVHEILQARILEEVAMSFSKSMVHSKSNSREVYSNAGLPQEIRKISNNKTNAGEGVTRKLSMPKRCFVRIKT